LSPTRIIKLNITKTLAYNLCHIIYRLPFVAEYANLPLVPPYLQPGNSNYYGGVNFASGGAGALVETFQGSVRSIS